MRARSNTGRRAVLRNQLVRMLEEAEAESDPENRGRLLTFVGFSGIECIAEMNDFLREAVCAYHNITEDDLRLILLQRGERILPELTPSLAAFAHKLLENRSIEIRLGAGLMAVTANAVLVEEKQTRRTETSRPAPLWPPSAGPHPILTALPPPQDKGRIVVDQATEVPDWPGVWAIGDCPAIRQIDGNISPPTAQHALRQAKTCAENIVAAYRNNSKEEIRLHRARKTQITWQALSGRGNPGIPPQGD